jgi:hypothetical protein
VLVAVRLRRHHIGHAASALKCETTAVAGSAEPQLPLMLMPSRDGGAVSLWTTSGRRRAAPANSGAPRPVTFFAPDGGVTKRRGDSYVAPIERRASLQRPRRKQNRAASIGRRPAGVLGRRAVPAPQRGR